VVPGQHSLLREIIVVCAESREVLRRETVLSAERVTPKEGIASAENVIESNRALIVDLQLMRRSK